MLEKQLVSIPFTAGLDTKNDEKYVLPGKLTTLENGIFTQANKIQKRNGYAGLPIAVSGATYPSITSGDGLVAYENELLLFSDYKLFSFSETYGEWVCKGPAYSVNVDQTSIIKGADDLAYPAMDIVGNYDVYAWQNETDQAVYASVFDRTTGVQLISNFRLSNTSNATRQYKVVLSYGGYAFIYFLDGANLKVVQFDPATPYQFSAATVLSTGWVQMDACVSGSSALVATMATAGTSYNVVYVSNAMAITATQTVTTAITSLLDISIDASSNIYILHNNATPALCVTGLASNFSSNFAPKVVSTYAIRATSAYVGSGKMQILYQAPATWGSNAVMGLQLITSAGTLSSPLSVSIGLQLASKQFIVGTRTCVIGKFSSTLQSTFYMIDVTVDPVSVTSSTLGNVIAKSSQGVAGSINQVVAKVPLLTATKAIFPLSLKTRFISENGNYYTLRGVASDVFDFSSTDNFYAKKLGENLLISGGMLSMYDGTSVVESGFHVFPEEYEAISDATAGSMTALGVYTYYICYEWTDNRGQVHRSSPGVGASVTLSVGHTSCAVSYLNLNLTYKKSPRSDAKVVIYRTISGGTVAYKITAITNSPLTSAAATYVDTTADADILGNEILYTTGGIVDNIAPPACKIVEVYKNRMMVSGLEDKLAIWYSKDKKFGEGVAFNDGFVLRVNALGGDIKAIKFMDDKFIIFKQDLIFALNGDGPNDAGQNNTFANAELVSSDCGCPYPNSTVLTPDGILFKSSKGIYMLSRQLQVSYIGAPVEAYNSLTVASADLIPNKNQVRFVHTDGVALLYDYYFNQWSVFTNHLAVDADLWRGVFAYLRTNGQVYKETPGVFSDNGTFIKLKMTTAWLKFQALQGFQRIKRMAFLGNKISNHLLTVSFGYDYKSTFDKTLAVTTTASSNGLYQYRMHMPIQKCESMRVQFEDSSTGTIGESFSLSDLTIEVGIKKGVVKLPSAQSI